MACILCCALVLGFVAMSVTVSSVAAVSVVGEAMGALWFIVSSLWAVSSFLLEEALSVAIIVGGLALSALWSVLGTLTSLAADAPDTAVRMVAAMILGAMLSVYRPRATRVRHVAVMLCLGVTVVWGPAALLGSLATIALLVGGSAFFKFRDARERARVARSVAEMRSARADEVAAAARSAGADIGPARAERLRRLREVSGVRLADPAPVPPAGSEAGVFDRSGVAGDGGAAEAAGAVRGRAAARAGAGSGAVAGAVAVSGAARADGIDAFVRPDSSGAAEVASPPRAFDRAVPLTRRVVDCPMCTFRNMPGSVRCEMCRNVLPLIAMGPLSPGRWTSLAGGGSADGDVAAGGAASPAVDEPGARVGLAAVHDATVGAGSAGEMAAGGSSGPDAPDADVTGKLFVELECPICLEEFPRNDDGNGNSTGNGDGGDNAGDSSSPSTARVLKCGHRFHKHCIEDWLNRETRCPCCRDRVDAIGCLIEDVFVR